MGLVSIRIHPVKACRGLEVERAWVERRGLRDDRRWMLVDDDGRCVSQRTFPGLTLVRATLEGDAIVLHRDGCAPCALPRRPTSGARTRVSVWSWQGDAIAFDEARAWFRRAVGQALRPVFLPDDVARPVSEEYGHAGDLVSFADAFPLLLASSSSLAVLNDRLRARGAALVTMERFRPNVVIDGAEPFAEEASRAVRIGALRFRAPKTCDRCAVPNVDPDTGLTAPEPIATLATFRRRDGAVWFGQNLVPDGEGEIRVGDEVVLEGASA